MARRGVDFSLLGLTSFTGDLDALRDDVRDRLEAVIVDTQDRIVRGALQRVPRREGDLANAIQKAGTGLSRSVGLADQAVPQRGGTNTAHRNPWVYGQWVENGLKNRDMLPQRFMGPAADEVEPGHLEQVESVLNGVLS